MKLCNRWLAALWFGLLCTALASSALAQVTTRLTVPGGTATSTKILPGSSVSFDIRVDATVGTIGTAYFLRQSSPSGVGAFFPFQLTGRSLTGSPYNDAGSFLPDGTILAVPSALLAPVSANNLGSSLLAGTPAAANILVSTITLSSNPASPLGVYTVRPDPTNAFVTDTSFIDYDMSGGAFNITIGQQLTVVLAGTGTGTVTANAGAINCPTVCSDIYPGTAVTLTPSNGTGTFAGWSGACTGTGSCVVTVDAAKSVTATFNLPTFALTVSKAGTGVGLVTSNPAGINCGATCTASYTSGTVVTLTAAPDRALRLRWLERRLHRHRKLCGHGRCGQVGDRHVQSAHIRVDRVQSRHGRRPRHQQSRGHQLRRHLHGQLHQRNRGHVDRRTDGPIGLRRLERGVHRHRKLCGHGRCSEVSHCHVRSAHVRIDRVQSRHRRRPRHQQSRGHQLRRHLLGQLHQRNGRHVDRRTHRALRVRWLERRVHRHRKLRGHSRCRQVGHRHIQSAHIRVDRVQSRHRRRPRHQQSRGHQLRRHLLGQLHQRNRGHA